MTNPNYYTDVKMSGPVVTAAKPDVDLGGVGFSYQIGLCWPAHAAAPTPMRPPATLPQQKMSKSGGPGTP